MGVVTYYGFHPLNGKRTLLVRDVDTENLPTIIMENSEQVASWNGKSPFTRDPSWGQAINQITRTEYDTEGRIIKTIDQSGVVSYIIYDKNRTMKFSAWDKISAKPILPINVTETNVIGKIVSQYDVVPSSVLTEGNVPVGITQNASKVVWTIYRYDVLHGNLEHIDKYHQIPAIGFGSLGTHFYRTSYINDKLGRNMATVQFVEIGKWQVGVKTFDWHDRITAIYIGVAMNPPKPIDLHDTTWLAITSKIEYEGPRISRQLSFFDVNMTDYTGTGYIYDSWGRLRSNYQYITNGTDEIIVTPFTVVDYDWKGRLVVTGIYETVPSWHTLIATVHYAETTPTGRLGLTKTDYDNRDRVYRRTIYEISSTGATANGVTTETYRDNTGRVIATAQQNGPRHETDFDALGRPVVSRTLYGSAITSLSIAEYDAFDHVTGMHEFTLNPGQITGIDLNGTNFVRQTRYFWYDTAGRRTTQTSFGSGGTIWANFVKPARPSSEPIASSSDCLVTKTIYDPVTGRANTFVDPKGTQNKTVFDAMGRTVTQFQNYKAGDSANADEDIEARFTYDGLDNLATLTAVNPTTGNQITRYLYEDTTDASLQTNVIYPDSSDTNSSGTDQVKTAYFMDGNVKQITDQNGNVRLLAYDSQRRQIADTVATLGASVDGNVRKITRSYNTFGALEKISTLDAQNSVLNEIKYEYDTSRRLKRLYQSHSGAVGPSAPYLEYNYDDNNHGRLAEVQYPNGKKLHYLYDKRDNIVQINDGANPVVEYLYDGRGAMMQATYNEPGVSLACDNGGLDRFGRIANHAWMKNNAPLVHILHGYDYLSNRTYRHDAIHVANSELYTYDQINQIKSLDRGVLNTNNDSVTVSNFTEAWDFDKTGNWNSYEKNGLVENRTHNAANEIQEIGAHDKNGNVTLMRGLKGKYDAWNRLVEIRDALDNLLSRYDYNGMNQRITKTVGGVVTQSFFNERWQELESQTEPQSSDCGLTSYIWGLRYLDDLVLREKGEERLYSLTDPNWNVVAVCDSNGVVQERMKYDAFGKITWLDDDFVAKANSDFEWNRTFTGQVLDAETGLMLYRNRPYSAEFGRFICKDPILYNAKDLNLLRYVFNHPVNARDVFGLEPSKKETAECCKNECKKIKEAIEKEKETGGTTVEAPSGIAICCKETAIACNFMPEGPTREEKLTLPRDEFAKANAQEIYRKCVDKHEESHTEDMDCKGQEDGASVNATKGYDTSKDINDEENLKVKWQSECKALRAMLGCFEDALDAGLCHRVGKRECEKQLKKDKKSISDEIDRLQCPEKP